MRGVILSVLLGLSAPVEESSPRIVEVGHWLEVRGVFEAGKRWVADRVELSEPGKYEVLIGSVPKGESDPDHFRLLDQIVRTSEKTEWQGLSPGGIAGERVKIEGYWRDAGKFSARKIAPRGEGRERIVGRVDQIRLTPEGVEARIMRFNVLIPWDVQVEHDGPWERIPLAPVRGNSLQELGTIGLDEDDLFGAGYELAPNLRLLGQVELRSAFEDDFNLDDEDREDRRDYSLAFRGRATWTPLAHLAAVAELRYRHRWREDDEDGRSTDGDGELGETFVYWRDALGSGLDVQVGRQDFDERREWIYDQNLDAVRVIKNWPRARLELSASTTLADGDERDEESLNLAAYLSNGNPKRHLALWTLYRDFDLDPDDGHTLHVGGRMYGHWVPEHKSWLDVAALSGERGTAGGDVALQGWGVDLGTTWSPEGSPFSLTAGYAYGSGDRGSGGSRDRTFRQTGFHDNNDRFAGVTSFRYYGELAEPELANLNIFTLGLGVQLAPRTSLDLVYHYYLQDHALDTLFDAEIDQDPNGIDEELGWELDLIFGSRRWDHWDLEIVGAWLRPGEAFDEDDDAFLGKIQLRYRF